MNPPFLWISLAFAAGVLSYPATSGLWPVAGGLLTASLPALWFLRGRRIFPAVLAGGFLLLGILSARADVVRPNWAVENFIVPGEKMQWGALTGVIETTPEIKRAGKKETVSFLLSAESIRLDRQSRKKAKGRVQVFLHQGKQTLHAGNRVSLWGTLQAPEGAVNPGGFDYAAYLKQQHVYALFHTYGGRSVRILGPGSSSPFSWIYRMQESMASKLDSLFPPPEAALFKAMVLGTRKGIDPGLRSDFLKTGTSHLIAISGLNIALVAGSIYFFLIVIGVGQKAAALLALGVTLVQVFVAGSGIPVQRAGWMAGAGFAAILLERERNSLNIFFLAFFLVLLTDIRSLGNVSFQLSFLSVFALILAARIAGSPPAWTENFVPSLAVLFLTSPLVLYYFSTFSPVGIIANLFAIPLFHLSLLSILICLAFAFWWPWAAAAFGKVASFFLAAGNHWIHFLSLFPYGYFFLPKPSLLKMAFYYVLSAVFLYAKFFKKARKIFWIPLAAAWILSAAAFFIPPKPPTLELTLFSAGKNEILHYQVAGKHWLINTGRSFPSDQAEWIIGPFLRYKGVKRLEGVILTDQYKKHTGGLRTLRRDFSVRQILRSSVVEIGGRFLFLQDLNAEIPERKFDVLILPADTVFSPKKLEAAYQKTRPSVIVMPDADAAVRRFWDEKGLAVLESRELGAVVLTVNEKGNLEAKSFLKGKIF